MRGDKQWGYEKMSTLLLLPLLNVRANIINLKESHLHNIKIGSKRAIVTHTHDKDDDKVDGRRQQQGAK